MSPGVDANTSRLLDWREKVPLNLPDNQQARLLGKGTAKAFFEGKLNEKDSSFSKGLKGRNSQYGGKIGMFFWNRRFFIPRNYNLFFPHPVFGHF